MRIDRFRPGFALPRSVAAASLAVVMLMAPLALIAQTPQAPPTQTQAPAAAAQAALPTARAIVDRHLKEIGGREAVLSHTSTKATGAVSIPAAGMTGTIEVFAAKPDKSVLKVNITGVGEVIEGYDGKTGWSTSPMTGPMILQGKQLEQKRFDADFYGELHDQTRYRSMTTLERTEFDGRQCYKVQLVRNDGSEDIEYYDVETGLKAGRVSSRETPMGVVTGTTTESDYKKFGNLLYSTTLKTTAMGVQQIITLTAVEHDTVAPSVFEPPAAIKALIK